MKIRTEFWQPPIPNRSFDWRAIDDDTYCCSECHSPVGHGSTEQEAIADLMEQIEPAEEAEKLPEPTMDDGYAEIARRDFARKIYEECDKEDAEEMGYIPDPRDEEPWSDTQTALEQQNSIKGR